MLDHHIQKSILYRLAFSNNLKFSELKPDELENKLFTYHLKKVISSGFVEKLKDGSYQLTPRGRRVGKGALKKDERLIDRAYSVIFLAIKRSEGDWLLFKRGSQPLLGLNGFMHTQPLPDTKIRDLASDVLKEKTNLSGSFEQISSGFLTVYKDDQLESFVNFTLLCCENAVGELHQNDALGEYYWANSPDFSSDSMLPTMKILSELIDTKQPFIEATVSIS